MIHEVRISEETYKKLTTGLDFLPGAAVSGMKDRAERWRMDISELIDECEELEGMLERLAACLDPKKPNIAEMVRIAQEAKRLNDI